MDWTRILSEAGIPESPGRMEAIAAAKGLTDQRKLAKAQSAKAKSKTKTKN